MCTKDRRIESRSVYLTEPNQNSHKKFLRKSSQRILNANHVDIMTETFVKR